jgi:hypothetical protein
MKKSFQILPIIIAILAIFASCTSCKKEKEVKQPKKEIKEKKIKTMTLGEYVISQLSQSDDSIMEVNVPVTSRRFYLKSFGYFKKSWTVSELEPYMKKYAFREIIIKVGKSQNLIPSPAHVYGGYWKGDYYYPGTYEPHDILTVNDERAAYWLKTNKDVYVFDKNGKELKPRK